MLIEIRKLYNILINQYFTNKFFNLNKNKILIFLVSKSSNKSNIKYIFQKLFKININFINIINIKGKKIKYKNITGQRKHLKKAIKYFNKKYKFNYDNS